MADRYEALSSPTLSQRLGRLAPMVSRLGDPRHWQGTEVGDGNLNLVFIVRGTLGSVVVKQALPYVRLVGESWPLPLSRSYFEYNALIRHQQRDPGMVPQVFHFDQDQALIVMEHLDRHIILRQGLIAGQRYEDLGRKLGLFCARTLFRGSDLSMQAATRKADLALFAGNAALCDITENLVFSDPYFDAPLNRHTPGLERLVADLRADQPLKVAAQHMKMAFTAHAETLLHGDLHSGSIMVATDDLRVIDPEFATYGPMGFDVGMLMANFLMAYLSQPGHAETPGQRDTYRDWILSVTADTWTHFTAEFARLWRTERTGILYQATLYEDQGHHAAAEMALADRTRAIWQDALGFCGVEMHRRILGLAHNADFERIANEALRARCEARALALGRTLLLGRNTIAGVDQMLALARQIDKEPPL